MPLDARQQRRLLDLSRQAIERGFVSHGLPEFPGAPDDAGLQLERASFATLTIAGTLRGCCGTLQATRTLADDAWRNAWTAAFRDPRFAPLTRAEYPAVDLTISVLSPPEPIKVGSEAELLALLRPGIDGLILEAGAVRATFLPAVWEQLPEPRRFLRQLKEKAGWPRDFWPAQIRVARYTTESFGEGR